MKWILIIVAIVVILGAIAWVTSGRAKGRTGDSSRGMSNAERDAAMRHNQRQQGAGGAGGSGVI